MATPKFIVVSDKERRLEQELARLRADSRQTYDNGIRAGRQHERELCALMVERMGAEGYGALAIAAAIRQMEPKERGDAHKNI